MGKGKEYQKVATVFAKKMDKAFSVRTLEGVMHGMPGDYLVTANTEKGESWPVAKDVFERTYIPVEK